MPCDHCPSVVLTIETKVRLRETQLLAQVRRHPQNGHRKCSGSLPWWQVAQGAPCRLSARSHSFRWHSRDMLTLGPWLSRSRPPRHPGDCLILPAHHRTEGETEAREK